MTGEELKKLTEGDKVYVPADDDDLVYSVLETDRMGRIKMQRIVYEISYHELWGEEYDTYDEALETIDEYRRRNIDSVVTPDDIEETTKGNPFWMDHREVELNR